MVEQGHLFVALPPLYRIDVGKEKFYALDEEEKESLMTRFESEKKRGKISETRFKGLGEMDPKQLRETSIDPNTRRLLKMTIDDDNSADDLMDMLLAKKRASDRKKWLESCGDLADV